MEVLKKDGLVMSAEVFKAAAAGYSYIIKTASEEDLRRKTIVRNNVVHLAFRAEIIVDYFVLDVITKYPDLMWESNLDGNTPLHFGAACVQPWHELLEKVCEKLTDPSPLRIQNSMGNTALHVAIIRNRFKIAHVLLDKDPYLAGMVNASMESPLHLALLYFPRDKGRDEDVEQREKKFRGLMMEGESTVVDKFSDSYSQPEKMGLIIRQLLLRGSEVAGWQDERGLTPLHIAATSVPTSYNLKMIESILEAYPQSMEVCDNSGKTVLHHLVNRVASLKTHDEVRKWLKETGLSLIRRHQDHQGNTAAHLSFINNDRVMLDMVYNSYYDSNDVLRNKQGMILTESAVNQVIYGNGRCLREEICHAARNADVFALLELTKTYGPCFGGFHDPNDGKNAIQKLFSIESGHVIIPKKFIFFVRMWVTDEQQNHYSYYRAEDKNGDTAAHILAQLNPDKIMVHLATTKRHILDPKPTGIEDLYPGPKPNDPVSFFNSSYKKYFYEWKRLSWNNFLPVLVEKYLAPNHLEPLTQNAKGNTALHEAIISQNDPVLFSLLEFPAATNAVVNNSNETYLHLLASRNPIPTIKYELMDNIMRSNTEDERHWLDEHGLSPIMIAIKAGNFAFADKLCSICPKLAQLIDPNGQTIWHLLVKAPPPEDFNFEDSFLSQENVLSLLEKTDNDENSALHLAIENRRFDIAKLFLSFSSDKKLLRIPNKKGETPGDVIGSLTYLPLEFEKFIWEDSTMIGTRSMWGVPTTQMKDYANTMGVIAALLTTITFTAAFTVPGGLNQEKGTPLLINDAAFQVFIIADVLAMCLSMMVLFCLLWIMATGDKSKSVVLLDFSIILLLASFYTTLLTFMTGLYATLHLVKPWIAIFSLVPCSMLLLLMHRYLVIKLVIPSGKLILVFVDKAFRSSKHAFLNAKKYCPWSCSTSQCRDQPSPRSDVPNV